MIENIGLLIKPASSMCNIHCTYCFYKDVAKNREEPSYGFMAIETLENLVKKVLETAGKSVAFSFQGGEPTLVGVEFYKKFHYFIEKYNKKNIDISFSIQTNGILLDEDWIELFKEKKYLVGVSLDGTKEVHDTFRLDYNGDGTFSKVFKSIKLLQENEIEFNILTVVNSKTVEKAEEIYNFFKDSQFKYLQFIPCLDNLQGYRGENFSLREMMYGEFLDKIFNFWYEDFKKDRYVSIRLFDNLLSMVLGYPPESCDMSGHCNINTVVESNGGIYPCDFYVLDKFYMGNINENTLENILTGEVARDFFISSFDEVARCKECEFFKLCRGGCRRHRLSGSINRFCKDYKYFYSRNIEKLIEISRLILQQR